MRVIQKVSYTSGSRAPGKLRGVRSGLVKYVMDKMKEKA